MAQISSSSITDDLFEPWKGLKREYTMVFSREKKQEKCQDIKKKTKKPVYHLLHKPSVWYCYWIVDVFLCSVFKKDDKHD